MTTIEQTKQRAEADAKTFGYYLVPDPQLLQAFLEGLKTNEDRYSYPLCPCRLTSGNFEFDRDIICPCDYRDPDIAQYGACYCRLYVNKAVFESKQLPDVPERRPIEKQARAYNPKPAQTAAPQTQEKLAEPAAKPMQGEVKKKLWYCKQCGYVVFREDAPYMCPICKAKKEMFEIIKSVIDFFS